MCLAPGDGIWVRVGADAWLLFNLVLVWTRERNKEIGIQASRQAFGAGHDQTARVRQELDAVRAARRGDEVDGSKLEREPIVLDKPDGGDEKTIDSID